MTKRLNVFKPEVYVQYSYLKLPNLYVEYDIDYDWSTEDDIYIEEEVVKKHLTKEYGKKYLKQLICDAIDNGEIEVGILIRDTDCYEYDNVIKNEDNPEILTHKEFLDLKDKYLKNKRKF